MIRASAVNGARGDDINTPPRCIYVKRSRPVFTEAKWLVLSDLGPRQDCMKCGQEAASALLSGHRPF